MVMINETKALIKDILKEEIPELSIEFAPDDPSNYKVKHPKGAVLIAYNGSSFSEPVGIQQTAVMNIEIVLCLRPEYNNKQGNECIDLVRSALTSDNFRIRGFRMWCSNISVDGEDGGIWYYTLGFVLPYTMYHGD